MIEKDLTEKDLAIAYRTVFNGTGPAKIVYNDLMKAGYEARMTDAFDGTGRIDHIGTAINNGKRFMALRINRFKNMDPNKEIQKEAD